MIEFKTAINLILKDKILVVFFVFAGLCLGWVNFAISKPSAYAVVSLVHDGTNEENMVSSYQYDGYYLIEATRFFGERLGQILRNPALNGDPKNVLNNSLKIKRIERLTLGDYKITINGETAVLNEYGQLLEEKISDDITSLAQETGEYANFTAKVSDFNPASQIPLVNRAIAGSLIGFLISIMVIMFRYYFKGGKL